MSCKLEKWGLGWSSLQLVMQHISTRHRSPGAAPNSTHMLYTYKYVVVRQESLASRQPCCWSVQPIKQLFVDWSSLSRMWYAAGNEVTMVTQSLWWEGVYWTPCSSCSTLHRSYHASPWHQHSSCRHDESNTRLKLAALSQELSGQRLCLSWRQAGWYLTCASHWDSSCLW